jgi:nitroreductase
MNEQPWAFVVATREDAQNHEKLVSVLMEANRLWARKAPVLILTVAHNKFTKNGNPNRHSFHDVGQAAANLVIQATSLGLIAHQMGGFSVEDARKQFAVPEDWDPVSVIALGYPGDPSSLSEQMRERETARRQRKPLESFVFSGAWGHPATIEGSR